MHVLPAVTKARQNPGKTPLAASLLISTPVSAIEY